MVEMNSLFLGDTHYPVSLSHPFSSGYFSWDSKLVLDNRGELASKAWGSGSAAKVVKSVISSMQDGISEVLEKNKKQGFHYKAAVYINACESGGMFDEASGTGDQLEKANAYVLAAANKNVPSSTFNPSMVRLGPWSSEDKTIYSVATSTFFGNFWHDIVHRSDILSISLDEEHRRIMGLAGPFTQFKGGSERNKDGFQGTKPLKFTPPSFGNEVVRTQPAGDFTVGPLFRYWYRKKYWSIVQQLKHRACLVGVEGLIDQSGSASHPIRYFHVVDILSIEIAEVVLQEAKIAIEKVQQMKKGKQKKEQKKLIEKEWTELFKLATKAKTYVSEEFMDPSKPKGQEIIKERFETVKSMTLLAKEVLNKNQFSRIKLLNRFLTSKAWKTTSNYFRKWLQGDLNSDEFARLTGKCQEIISIRAVLANTGGDDTEDTEDNDEKIPSASICNCLGYDLPHINEVVDEDDGDGDGDGDDINVDHDKANLNGLASTSISTEGKGFIYPSAEDHKWNCVTDTKSSGLSAKEGKMMLSIHSVHLEPKKTEIQNSFLSFFSGSSGPVVNTQPVTVEALLHRGVVTDADIAAHIGRKQIESTLPSTPGADPTWPDETTRTVLAFNKINQLSNTDDNKDALVFKVLGETGEFLGEVSMSAAALMGFVPANNRKTGGVTITLPLHKQFNGADASGKKLKAECRLKGKDLEPQKSECASHHEWIPTSDALKWSIENPTKHYLMELMLATPKVGDDDKTTSLKPQKLAPQTKCDTATTDCVKLYTDDGDAQQHKYGTITFNVLIIRPDNVSEED